MSGSRVCSLNRFFSCLDVNAQLKLLNLGSGFAGLNIAEKCLRVSRALGDWYGVDLWTVAIYYLEVAVAEKNSSKEQAVSMKSETVSMDLKRTNKYPHIEPLDTCYDYLADPFSYQVRILVFNMKKLVE